MGTILVCTQKDDIVREMGPVLWGEHQVAIVPRVADAVRLLLLTRYDAVVLDMDEERQERLEALPVISRLNPRLPILAVSGKPSVEAESTIRSAGTFCLLPRPLARGELERHLAAALGWRAAEAPRSRDLPDAEPEPTPAR